ncbi:MAG: CrcB-related protein [Clostridia bacterium]|jgi:CrcB protein|nr:CrcB-related protein [Clostridia bacterium]
MSFIIVGIGGMLGSVARYSAGQLVGRYHHSAFPWATFLVNIVGALLLGAVNALNFNNGLYLLLGEGFLGAFTTFSTFMYEGVSLIKSNQYLNVAIYIVITLILGIAGFGLGYIGMTTVL